MRLLVDISHLIYRSAFKLADLSYKGQKTGAVFGTLKILENLASGYEAKEMVIVWDGGYDRRSKIYPEYKATRRKDPELVEDIRRQKNLLRGILSCLPLVQIQIPTAEADDCIEAIATFTHLEMVGIVSGDKDLHLLADPPKHFIVSPNGERVRVTHSKEKLLVFKVLTGDVSDNVKGVQGIGPVKASKLIETCPTVADLLHYAKSQGGLGNMDYHDVEKVIRRNVELLTPGRILTAAERKEIIRQYTFGRLKTSLDLPLLRERLLACGFSSIIARLGGFTAPFKGMARHGKDQLRPDRQSDKPHGHDRQEQWQAAKDRWVRIIRVVDRRDEKGRGEDEGPLRRGAGNAGARRKLDISQAAAAAIRLRKAKAFGVASEDTGRGIEGTLRSNNATEIPRTSGVRLHPKGSLYGPPPQLDGQSRVHACNLLKSLQTIEGRTWLKRQPSDKIKKLKMIIDRLEAATLNALTPSDVAFVGGLYEDFTGELPVWAGGND